MGCAFDKQQPPNVKPNPPQNALKKPIQKSIPSIASVPTNEVTTNIIKPEIREKQQMLQPPASPLQIIKVENNFLGPIHNPTVQKGQVYKKQNHYGEIVSQETNLIYNLQFGVGMQEMPSTISI